MKTQYQIPHTQVTNIQLSHMVLAGSGTPGLGIGEEISGGEGG